MLPPKEWSSKAITAAIGRWPGNAVLEALEDAKALLPHLSHAMYPARGCTEENRGIIAAVLLALDWIRFNSWHWECLGLIRDLSNGEMRTHPPKTKDAWADRRDELDLAVRHLLGPSDRVGFGVQPKSGTTNDPSDFRLTFAIGWDKGDAQRGLALPAELLLQERTRWLILPQFAAELAMVHWDPHAFKFGPESPVYPFKPEVTQDLTEKFAQKLDIPLIRAA